MISDNPCRQSMGLIEKLPQLTDLHRFLSERDWEAAQSQLIKYPKEARIWSEISLEDGLFTEILPLHHAVQGCAPIWLIQQLLKAYPKACIKRDTYFYRCPLHFACLDSPYEELIRLLIDQNREAVLANDVYGRLPLHYAVFSGAHEIVVQSLLEVYPNGAQILDSNAWLPLHVAVRYKCSYGVIDSLVRAYPQALYIKTKRGHMTPADIANKFQLDLDECTEQLLLKPRSDHRRSSSDMFHRRTSSDSYHRRSSSIPEIPEYLPIDVGV